MTSNDIAGVLFWSAALLLVLTLCYIPVAIRNRSHEQPAAAHAPADDDAFWAWYFGPTPEAIFIQQARAEIDELTGDAA